MSIPGYQSNLGSTSDFTLTRNELIELAHKVVGVLEPDNVLDAEMLSDGNKLLNMRVREVDASGRWRWTVQESYHLPLAANTNIYTPDNKLPDNIAELHSVVYRDSSGFDSAPLKIVKAEGYEEIQNKFEVGPPQKVYLTENIVLGARSLYIWPMLGTITTMSAVNGQETPTPLVYGCIAPHTGAAVSQPTVGANWKMYWQQMSGVAGTTWSSGANYTSPQLLRLLYRRPLYDFDESGNTPDFPLAWPRLLLYLLAEDVGRLWGVPKDDIDGAIAAAKGSYDNIFPGVKAKSNTRHNKVKYF